MVLGHYIKLSRLCNHQQCNNIDFGRFICNWCLGVTHSAAGDLTTSGSGTITVSATSNDVIMADGTVYSAGGGAVSVTGADEVLLGKITNPLGTVAVTATAGDISDETSAEGSSNENIGGQRLLCLLRLV